MPVPRRPRDAFGGVCPFHGDCLEGMASGPAIAARFGRRAEELEGDEVAAAAEVVAFYLASALRGIVFTLAPERIVLGGGLSQVPGLVVRTRRALARAAGELPGARRSTRTHGSWSRPRSARARDPRAPCCSRSTRRPA